MDYPLLVSIVVPCRNERNHIKQCVTSILEQQRSASGDYEILIVDGMSTDGTRDILRGLATVNSSIRIVDNPSGITASAMNIGIGEARGRYIAILGAHTEYAADYIRTCVELLDEHPEAACVGGPIVTMGRSLFGQAVAAAMSHPVGIGNAKHRHPSYQGYAEGACYPVFRKAIFEKIGLYDEQLIRNQDDELNYRLTKSGGKVFISPRARSVYFARETVWGLSRQYFQYGYWRVAVLRKHRVPASIRQIVAPISLFVMLVITLISTSLPGWWRLAPGIPISIYAATLLIVGMRLIGKADWRLACLFPIAAGCMHAAYAIGFACGVVKGPHGTRTDVFGNKGEYHASRT